MTAMTQDQYGQARGSGYVVRGDVVPEEETEEYRNEESRPMTRFQKVASALRGGGSDREEHDRAEADQAAADRAAADQEALDRATADRVATDRAAADPDAPAASPPWVTPQDEAAMAGSPIVHETESKRDYWDEPGPGAGGPDEPVAVTRPVVPDSAAGAGTATGAGAADHAATEPDMFGAARRQGDDTMPLPEGSRDSRDQGGAATIADVPAAGTPAAGPSATDVPAGGTAADDAGAATGRHAAATTPAGEELRPGEAAGTLGDFSDLTYGNLVPDAATYTAQWQQIQFKFVDDPRASVTEAADIVAQVTAKLEAAIQERQRAIEERQRAITEQQRSLRGRWGEGTNADTETLRETLRMYKTFLDQLIGPRAG
jgi:hypothetical protein